MFSTQSHIPIEQIKDNLIITKDGSMALVLQTTAVNFGLLSENEQLGIISGFAGLLNSLNFSIQILIRSKKLDISSYLKLLEKAQTTQKNPLLAKMMANYRTFIERTVRENDVLDKKFYIIVSVSFLELGLTKNIEGNFQKGLTILIPRRDQIVKQFWRTGLKATQLDTKQLISLFYDFYNNKVSVSPTSTLPLQEKEVEIVTKQLPSTPQTPVPSQPQTPPQQIITQQPKPRIPQPTPQLAPATQNYPPRNTGYVTPFVVEELVDDYGSIT